MKRETEPPKTMRQAQTWETVKNRYLAAGLCIKCASQAAYGHQLGFSRVHPPCDHCVVIVVGFPIEVTAMWRRLADPSRKASRPFPQNRGVEPSARESDDDSQGRRDSGDQPGPPSVSKISAGTSAEAS